MAANAIVYKASLQISDMDRHYYHDHPLTLARHPSETEERMMIRLLAFAMHAHERLRFGRGLSVEDEPALWQKDLTGLIEVWIEVGLPEEKAMRQACGCAKQVYAYAYGGRGADLWWKNLSTSLGRLDNLTVFMLPLDESRALAQLAQPSMALHCTIQDGSVYIGDATGTVQVEPTTVKQASTKDIERVRR